MYLKTKLLKLICPITGYLDPEKKTIFLGRKNKDTCLILHCIVTPLTTLLVSEIKMAAQIPRSKVSDVLQACFSGKSP